MTDNKSTSSCVDHSETTMSSIPSSNPIASSLSQSALQQSEVAKGGDRARSEQARFAQKMREKLREHLETVEDSYEATDELLHIDDRDSKQESGAEEDSSDKSDVSSDDADGQKPKLDIEA
jgi:hypothetical protein